MIELWGGAAYLSSYAALLVLTVLLAGSAAAAPSHIYVDVRTGQDTNAGTQSAPYQSLSKAMVLINQLKNLDGHIVHVAAGTYEPGLSGYHGTDTLTFSIVGEGTSDDPVIIDGGKTNTCFRISNSNKRGAFSNVIFRNGCYTQGGGIYCERGWTHCNVSALTNCVFENCSATNGYGGGVYSYGFSMDVVRCTFSNCTATAGGGAVCGEKIEGDHSFSHCTFASNASSQFGGAVHLSYPNSSTGKEGEITRFAGVFRDCLFTNNVATTQGGALCCIAKYATNTVFVGNRAVDGAVWFYNGYSSEAYQGDYRLTNAFVDCVFADNRATTGAGCFSAIWNKRFLFDSCTIRDNRSDSGCSFLSLMDFGRSEQMIVRDCLFERNRGEGLLRNSTAFGYYDDFRVQFLRTTFQDNDSGSGALLYLSPKNRMDGCIFRRNQGGASCRYNDSNGQYFTNEVRNCLFVCNTNKVDAGAFRAFWTYATTLRMENCTFADNVSKSEPYGFYVDSWCGTDNGNSYANLLFHNNRGQDGETGAQVPSMINQRGRYCWLETGSTTITQGTRGCIIGTDPCFVSAATGDYSVQRRSKARDAGLLLDWMISGAKDLSGNGRVNGDRPDIGAYECWLKAAGLLMIVR